MRAGPLANQKIIAALNASFVPVYTVNEDYAANGDAPKEEKAELQRIRQEGYRAKLSVGTVHAYVLTPDGHTHDSLHVATAAKPEKTLEMLERAIEQFKPKAGAPLVTPSTQSKAPRAPEGGSVFHLVSRSEHRGSWGEFPAENWITLNADEVGKLLPGKPIDKGQTWKPDRDTAAKLLTYFYPQTENNNADPRRIQDLELTAKVLEVKPSGEVRARLDGRLTMQHSFYPGRKDPKPVEAIVVGHLTCDSSAGKLLSLQLVTDKARYNNMAFDV